MGRRKTSMRPAAADAAAILGSFLREARVDRGWTMRETAEFLGISRKTYANLEEGASGATSIAHAFNAADALGVPLFNLAPAERARFLDQRRKVDALLPDRVVPKNLKMNNDF